MGGDGGLLTGSGGAVTSFDGTPPSVVHGGLPLPMESESDSESTLPAASVTSAVMSAYESSGTRIRGQYEPPSRNMTSPYVSNSIGGALSGMTGHGVPGRAPGVTARGTYTRNSVPLLFQYDADSLRHIFTSYHTPSGPYGLFTSTCP